MKIGYIGLGNMGGPMAVNLARAGRDVLVYDLDQSKVDVVVAEGARDGVSGAAIAAEVDILFTSLPEPRHVAAELPGWLDVMKPGSIWVDTTTNERDLLIELNAKAQEKEIRIVEAPCTGAVDGARLAKLVFFVAGDDTAAIETVRPYFEDMGSIILCGALGMGNVVKVITNQVCYVNAAMIGEALAVGKKAGVDLRVLWEAMQNSVADTFIVRHDVPSIFAGHYDPSFNLHLSCKDLRLVTKLGSELESQMDITRLALNKFETAVDTYGGDAPFLMVAKLIEEASDVNLQVEGDWVKHWEV